MTRNVLRLIALAWLLTPGLAMARSDWSERQTKAYWDVDKNRLSSRYSIGLGVGGSRGVTTLPNARGDQTLIGGGAILHAEGSIIGLFMRPGGSFYVRDWWTMTGGLGPRTTVESSNATNIWFLFRFEPALRAVARIDDATEVFGSVGMLSFLDTTLQNGGSLQSAGATGLKLGGGGRAGDLYGEAAYSPSVRGSPQSFMLGAAYRYAHTGFMDWIGARAEYLPKYGANDNSILMLQLVWASH